MLELNMSESTHRSMALTSHGTDGGMPVYQLSSPEGTQKAMGDLYTYFPGIQFTIHQVIVQGWPWNTLVATRLSIAAPRSDGGAYRNEAMQFLRLRWGKVVEDRLHEDTYKLVNELQERLSQVDQV